MALIPEDIAEQVKAGDPDAVGAVYVLLADRLLGYLVARVHDRATAEDLLEATFLELLQKGRSIRGGGAAIKVWLFRAAHFNALDHLRKVRRRGDEPLEALADFDIVDVAATPEEAAVSMDTARHVRAAMENISDDQRQVLLLRHVAGLSSVEVAAVMRKSPGAVRSLQHRGERALARVLDGSEQSAARPPVPSEPSDSSKPSRST